MSSAFPMYGNLLLLFTNILLFPLV
jgi:hypothetical protein